MKCADDAKEAFILNGDRSSIAGGITIAVNVNNGTEHTPALEPGKINVPLEKKICGDPPTAISEENWIQRRNVRQRVGSYAELFPANWSLAQ